MDPNPPRKDKKGSAPDARVCGNCDGAEGSASAFKLSACARCGLVVYCSKYCQRTHWKANHKHFCVTKADRAPPPQATMDASEVGSEERRRAAARAAAAGDECAICLDPLTEASACTLPCAHVFHAACVEEMRKFGVRVKQVCPMCRAELLPGEEKLFEEACRRYVVIERRVTIGGASWGALTNAEQQEIDEVARLWREEADKGLAEAQFALGVVTFNGHGVKQDYFEATKLWRKAANQGHADAQIELGLAYADGRGAKKDYYEANKWWRKAAAQGIARAQSSLGMAYDKGRGVKQDYSEANKWWRKAADQGHANAACNLGSAYHQGYGVEQDYSEANMWFRKAADQGNAHAQFNLGLAYGLGYGVKQDYFEANTWYRKAVDQGDARAQCNLGCAYAEGKGVKQDYCESVKWWRKAADQGHLNAQCMIAQCYECGLGGLSVNLSTAIELYTLSANQTFEPAKVALNRMKASALFVEQLIGAPVKLTGLQAKPDKNGATGVVKSFNEATGRFAVQLDTGEKPFMLKIANLKRI